MNRTSGGCRKDGRKIVWTIPLFILFTLFLTGCRSPYSSLFWLTAPRQELRVLVPDGYTGPILIGWQVPEGDSAEVVDDALIYRVHEDGALMLRDDPPDGVGQWSFWYENQNGQLTPIPNSTCFDDAPETGVVVCVGMMAASYNDVEVRPNMSYLITSVANKRQYSRELIDDLLPAYSNQLEVPPEFKR